MNFEQFSENLYYQVRSFRKVSQSFNSTVTSHLKKGSLPPIRSALKSEDNKNQSNEAKELALTIQGVFQTMGNGLEKELKELQDQTKAYELNEFMDEEVAEIDNADQINLQEKNLIRVQELQLLVENDFVTDRFTVFLEELQENPQENKDEIILVSEYMKAFRLLYERYNLEVEKLQYQITTSNEDLTSLVNPNLLNDQLLYLAHSNSIHCMQRLQLHFPQHSRSLLQSVVDWARKIKDLAKKINILRRGWREEYSNLHSKTERLLIELLESKVQKRQIIANQLELKQTRLNILNELEEKRKDYEEKMKEKLELEEKNQQQEAKERKIREQQWLSHKAEIEKVSLLYKQQKAQKQKQEEEQIRLIQTEKEKQLIQQIEQNKPKVQMRQNKEIEKLYDKIYNKEMSEIKKEENENRIESAIQNYPFRPKPQFDPERLVKETEGRIIRKNVKYDKADKIALTNVNGYSVQQLMGDMRYRLNAALNDAGLQNTQYAHDLLIGMSKRNN